MTPRLLFVSIAGFAILCAVATVSLARTWTDSTGKFHTEATLVAFRDGIVHLKTPNGEVIRLPIEKLSDDDQKYIHARKRAVVDWRNDIHALVTTTKDQQKKLPSVAALQSAKELVLDVFGQRIQEALQKSDKVAIAKELVEHADVTAENASSRFALLHQALILLVEAEDVDLVDDAIANMENNFAIDGLALRALTLPECAGRTRSATAHRKIAEKVFPLIAIAVADDRYDVAIDLAGLAKKSASSAKSNRIAQDAVASYEAIEALRDHYVEVEIALATLQQQPDDPKSNLVAGRYLSLIKGNWSGGLPHLALGGDGELQKVAAVEVAANMTPSEMMDVAERWQSIAENEQGLARLRCLQHARDWYGKLLDQATGLTRIKVKKEFDELADVEARHEGISDELWRIIAGTNRSGGAPAPVIVAGEKPTGLFDWRKGNLRAAAVSAGGGNADTEAAVEAGLAWLASHQNRDGSWSWNWTVADNCSGFQNPGDKQSKMGATGMALMAFLGAGYTHQAGDYRANVRNGLRYLVGNMIVSNNAGRLFEANGASHEHMYCHGIATWALSEAYGMTGDRSLVTPAQLAVNYIVAAQHPEVGGWLYTPRTGGDTSVSGWQMMALKSAGAAGLRIPARVKPLASRWLDSVQWGVPQGSDGVGAFYGYRKSNDRPEVGATTPIGLLGRLLLGTDKTNPGVQAGVDAVAASDPPQGNTYYNYYASMLIYQVDGPQGERWKAWNAKMRDYLLQTRERAGNEPGSWYFEGGGHGSQAGGRIYCTAMACMILETYYRYSPQ